jgi:hypothetical protein
LEKAYDSVPKKLLPIALGKAMLNKQLYKTIRNIETTVVVFADDQVVITSSSDLVTEERISKTRTDISMLNSVL